MKKHYKFYKWWFRITIAILLISMLYLLFPFDEKAEKKDCIELADNALIYYNFIVKPSIPRMNYSEENKAIAIGYLNTYLNMSKEFYLCTQG